MTDEETESMRVEMGELVTRFEKLSKKSDEHAVQVAGCVLHLAYCACYNAGVDLLASMRLIQSQLDEKVAREARQRDDDRTN